MVCEIWEEKGLLYLADELDESESNVFESHLAECETCRRERELYLKEKENFFKPEIFEDEPSTAVDNEILRLCSDPVRPTGAGLMFPSFVKKIIFALLILSVGFVGGAYFAGLKEPSNIKQAETNMEEKVQVERVATGINRSGDPADDSTSDSAVIFKRGNLTGEGVVPVDLTQE